MPKQTNKKKKFTTLQKVKSSAAQTYSWNSYTTLAKAYTQIIEETDDKKIQKQEIKIFSLRNKGESVNLSEI